MESDIDPARDAWMRRTGPFFPLVVSAAGQTRLPLAPGLLPTDDDVSRAEPWAPVVGLLLGVVLGFAAALFGGIGLGDVAVASIVATLWVILGGAWAEFGLARYAERFFTSEDSRGFSVALSFTVALVVSLLLRVALLSSIHITAWTGALMVSAAVARFTPVAAHHGRSLASVVRGKAPPPAWPLFAAAATVVIGLPIVFGAAALVAVLASLVVAAIAALYRLDDEAAAAVIVVELCALVCFAAASTFPLFG